MYEAIKETPNFEGFNTCYILDSSHKQPLKKVAKVIDPKYGIGMGKPTRENQKNQIF